MRIDPSGLAARISGLVDGAPRRDLSATLQQVVDAAKLLFGIQGAGLMLVDEQGSLHWVSASDQQAQLAEDHQELLGRGPCVTAFSQRAPAVMRDARRERDWGEIALAFSEIEIAAAASVPIELGGGPIGTLNLYATQPRDWDECELGAAQAYAGVIASLLAAACQAETRGRVVNQLHDALRTRVLVEQAKGALMVRQRIDEATAWEWLRLSARASSRTVSVVAREVLAGHWPPMSHLATVMARLARARQAERRAHEQAIELHERSAEQYHRLGQRERAAAERDRANLARKRLQRALAEQEEQPPA